MSFRDVLKIPLAENNHHVTYIDEYVNIICEAISRAFREDRTLDGFSVKLTEDDFAYIPDKFFDECKVIVNYRYDTKNGYSGGYNYNATVVDENEKTKNIEDIPIEKRIFDRIYGGIAPKLIGIIREKARKGQQEKVHGVDKPIKLK